MSNELQSGRRAVFAGFDGFVLECRGATRSDDELTPTVAGTRLRWAARDSRRRALAAELRRLLRCCELDDELVLELGYRELTRPCGRLVMRRLPLRTAFTRTQSAASELAAGAAQAVVSTASEVLDERDWIELLVVDDLDQPVRGVMCEVVLPNRSVRSGRTNASGIFRCDGIVSGSCAVSLVNIHVDEWTVD